MRSNVIVAAEETDLPPQNVLPSALAGRKPRGSAGEVIHTMNSKLNRPSRSVFLIAVIVIAGWMGVAAGHAQLFNWSTIAGNPTNSGAVDGTNGGALFWQPSGICADTNGNIYVCDSYNSVIREIVRQGTNWVVTTIAGKLPQGTVVTGYADGTNDSIQFNTPNGIAVDAAGDLYVADSNNNIIRK